MNGSTLRVAGFTLLCGLLGSTVPFSLAVAQTSAPYQATKSCGPGFCQMYFATVPSGKRLEVSNITCFSVLTPAGAQIRDIELDVLKRSGATVTTQFLSSTTQASDSSGSTSVATAEVFVFVNQAQYLEITIDMLTGSAAATCSISGHMITL